MLVAPRKEARECSQITATALRILHHKHAEHLSARSLLAPQRIGGHHMTHSLGRPHTQRMGSIGKGIVEACGKSNRAHCLVEKVKLFHRIQDKLIYLAVIWKQACLTSCFT